MIRSKRQHAKAEERYIWPNATVPIHFDSNVISKFILSLQQEILIFYFFSAPEHEGKIREMFQIIENSTCVRFVNYTNEEDFVNVTWYSGGSCKSKIGRRGGSQSMKMLTPWTQCQG